ncbi:hypothetical protein LAZ67_5004288 [Cordylochernes scorpioides]|uniref:Transposase n=1 Tax=Cordylochernes scorpioides TaxID=51811 RepID=A0ABY6KHX7_9ARAC|nr:hypothetical protein LAZ67_5004288 [Cordylochernes scorpioides]
MENVEVIFFPANTTSVIQPMDKGVIKNLKHFYRRFLFENILTGDSEALKIKLDVLQASRLCKKAWDQVTSETIKHCFKKAGFVKKEEDEENADDIIAETMPSVDGWEDVISNPTISYDDLLNVDDDVAVCGEITDADIIAEVLNHNIEKQDGDEASGDEDESSVAGEINHKRHLEWLQNTKPELIAKVKEFHFSTETYHDSLTGQVDLKIGTMFKLFAAIEFGKRRSSFVDLSRRIRWKNSRQERFRIPGNKDFRLEPTARARSLFSSLQFPTKDTSLVSLVLAEQPLVMELPLVSPASCELRSVIRFLAAKKNSAKDIHTELCQVYGEGCMSSGMVRRWVREFKNSRTDVHDEPRAGRPSVSDENIAKVEAAMLEDRRVTVRKLCDLVPDVSKTTIDKILREHLGYSKVCAIWVPKMLTEDHKRQRVYVAQKFLDCHKTDGEEFLDSIVTGDVTWVHYTTPETKEQSKQWNHISSPKPLKFKQTLSAGKLMATVFWDRKGLLLCDFMRLGTTINSDRYCKTLKQLRRAIQNKRRGMLTKGVRFHHDNARPHTARQTTALIEEFEWELVSHPPYSPDVAPSDFHFFPELKKNLGGTQFQDDDELEEAVLGFYVARRQSSSTLGSISGCTECKNA